MSYHPDILALKVSELNFHSLSINGLPKPEDLRGILLGIFSNKEKNKSP